MLAQTEWPGRCDNTPRPGQDLQGGPDMDHPTVLVDDDATPNGCEAVNGEAQ